MSICFELIISPIKPELAMVTVLKATAAESCSAGMEWSDAANRCLVKATTAKTQRDLEACAKEADPKACYERNANKAANTDGTSQLSSGDIQAMYKGNSFMLNVAKTAAYSLPLMLFGYMLVSHKKGEKRCLPPSTIAMMAAGVTMMGGEVYGFIKHKSNLKKLDEARKNLLTPKATDNLDQKKVDATQMQSEAFQLLADEQASVESLAKAKKIFYGVAMSAYAAAAGIAAYELIAIKMAKAKLKVAVGKASAQATAAPNTPQAAQLPALMKTYASVLGDEKAFDASKTAYSQESIAKTKTQLETAKTGLETAQNTFNSADKDLTDAKVVRKGTKTEADYKTADADVTKKREARNNAKNSLRTAESNAKKYQDSLTNLTSTSQGVYPDVANAAMNLRKVLVNYECWQEVKTELKNGENQSSSVTTKDANGVGELKSGSVSEETTQENEDSKEDGESCSITVKGGQQPNGSTSLRDEKKTGTWQDGECKTSSNKLMPNHDLKNLRLIATQIHNIKNARSVEELMILTEELNRIKSGSIESELMDVSTVANFQSPSDKLFLQVNSELTALQAYNEYFQEPEVSQEKIIEKVFSVVQNSVGFPSAHAQGNVLTSILGVIPLLLGASSLFKKKDGGGNSTAGTDKQPVTIEELNSKPEIQNTRDGFGAFVRTPTFRIAFGGVLGGLTYFMVKEMGDQQKTAKARKETLLKLKGDFENTQGMKICTPAERNDQSQPGCFCYTAEGGKNTARSNSTVCQNMWNSVNLNGNGYLADGDSTKVCITQSNAVDESCSCRASNTCLKASAFNISGISLGTLSTLGSGLAPIATASSGNGASLNTDAVVNGAMKLRDATDKILASSDLKNENAIVKAAEQSLGNFVQANGGTLSSPSARSMPSSLANFDAKAALEELKEEAESAPKTNGMASYGSGFDSQTQEPSLEFGLTPSEAAIQEEQVAEVLNQDMDLGNNDISGSSTNLFEVLSHRYQRSGMRRLFNLEDKTQAEKPAQTDINQ